MKTSKSYDRTQNNAIKLELDDLEYVFTDGQNLVIDPDVDNEETQDANFVYTDGSQTVLLQAGVKHFIQTISGETYLVGNDDADMQHLVINTEDESGDTNNEVEYIQSDENGETVIYKLTDANNEGEQENCEEPQAKRFKIAGAEYVALETDDQQIQLNSDNQFSIVEENSVSDSSNYQYAVLKDGKVHLQLYQDDSPLEIVDEDSEQQIENVDVIGNNTNEPVEQQRYIIAEEEDQEYVLVNADRVSVGDVDFSTLIRNDNYINRSKYRANKLNVDKESQNNSGVTIQKNHKNNHYLNKKMLIRKNRNGKSLFCKILDIQHPTKKTAEDKEKQQLADEPIQTQNNQNVDNEETLNVEAIEGNPSQIIEADQTQDIQTNADNTTDEQQQISEHSSECILTVDNPQEVQYNQDISEEQMQFLSKTLNGLFDMPSLRKKLTDRKLEIKLVERRYNSDAQGILKDIKFVSGYLMRQDSNEFVMDSSDEQRNVTSLTVTVTHDSNNQTITKVTFHDKPVVCQVCNRIFKSLGVLNRHTQTHHSDDKSLSCTVCQVKFTNPVTLAEHRKSTGHFVHYVCKTCNKKFTTQGNLNRHQSVHEHNPKQHECVVCRARFAHVSSLSKHLITHAHVKAYQCDSCGKGFSSLAEANAHKRTHNPVKTCFCEICGREFSRHSNLLRHTEIHKGDGDLYKCGICECSYKFISSLTRHIVQNHMQPQES